jgi:transposase InsO family protein
MNYVYTYPSKADTVKTIKAFYAFIETQYNTKIRIFKRDSERTLGKAYKKWIRKKGIKEEISAPYTPEQNGAAERSGGVANYKSKGNENRGTTSGRTMARSTSNSGVYC